MPLRDLIIIIGYHMIGVAVAIVFAYAFGLVP